MGSQFKAKVAMNASTGIDLRQQVLQNESE